LTEVKRTIKFIESFLEIVWKLFGNGPKSLKQPISYKPYKLVVSWVLGCGWASWGSGLALACWLRSETREQGFSVKMGKARMSTKDETGGSEAGGNRAKLVAAGSVPFNGDRCARLVAVELGVCECAFFTAAHSWTHLGLVLDVRCGKVQ
jgi:hypothetical protein